MTSFADLSLKVAYHKGRDDIAEEFYLPCLSRSLRYDRAVAYFSSSIYVIAWPAMRDFVRRGGKIRIICSPHLSAKDALGIESGYVSKGSDSDLPLWKGELARLLEDPVLRKPTLALSSMVASGIIDFRIALVRKGSDSVQHDRLFHSKLGLFYDRDGSCVAFKGSMNESARGLSSDGNIETVDVFVGASGGRDLDRIKAEQAYFDNLWNNKFPGTLVHEFSAALKSIITAPSNGYILEELVDEASLETTKSENRAGARKTDRKRVLPHQANALTAWEAQGRRGILEHATGSGKTFTAICAIRSALLKKERPIVLVPSELLLEQWQKELRENLSDLDPQILCAGAGYDKWRSDGLLASWTRKADRARLVISTMHTACGEAYKKEISSGEHLFIVADEVHRMGSPELRKALEIPSGPRLGLSATPRRAGDPEGTQVLVDYFGPIVEPPYTLKDAIKDGRLTPYFYRVHPLSLTAEEQQAWDDKTHRIGQLFARNKQNPDPGVAARLALLQIERSRIAKSASGKPALAVEILRAQYKDGDRWIVYCDNREQLGEVLGLLQKHSMNAFEYHSYMDGDQVATLQAFNALGGIIVSIKCLDEGVDIPSTSHALILASSKNPREFIQRRGRVLRIHQGKIVAHIHDVITIPFLTSEPQQGESSLLRSELARAIQFGRDALNPDSVIDLQRIALRQKLDPEKVAAGGYEDNE